MTAEEIKQQLSDANLNDQIVEQLVDKYQQMETELKHRAPTQVIATVEEFCEAFVHLLHIELGEPLNRGTDVTEFTQKTLAGEIATDAPSVVRTQFPHMLSAAHSTVRPRSTALAGHKEMRHYSDARAGVAIASWLLTELVRLYATTADHENTAAVASSLNNSAVPPEDRPLNELVRSRYAYDEQQLAEALNQTVYLVREDKTVATGPRFESYDKDQQVTALLLGQMAAYTRSYAETLGVKEEWLNKHIDGTVCTHPSALSFVVSDSEEGGYYIPGFNIEEAISFLEA